MKTCFPPLIVVALCAFLQVAETHAQAPAPNQTFNITLADAPVSVERWGTGPTAIIFFGFWPFDIQEIWHVERSGQGGSTSPGANNVWE